MRKDNLTDQKYLPVTDSNRVITTPSKFAKDNLFYLQEIGELTSLKPHKNQRTALDSFLVALVENGSGIFHYDGMDYAVKKGNLIFINCKNYYYHISNESNPWTLKWIHFNGPKVPNYYNYFFSHQKSILVDSMYRENIITLFEQTFTLSNDTYNEIEFEVSHLLNRLLTLLLTSSLKNKASTKNIKKIEYVKHFIDNHFQEKITLDYLSQSIFISKYHMSREFKRKYGITIISYLNAKKITYAKERLRFTNLPIQNISDELNINDKSYFNKIFKKIEGLSPSDYRKKWNGS